MDLPAVDFQSPKIDTDRIRNHERLVRDWLLCLPRLHTDFTPTGDGDLSSAEEGRSDGETLSMPVVGEDERNGEAGKETSSSAFSPINASFEIAGYPSPTYWEVQNLDPRGPAISDAAPSRTFADWLTTPGIVNGRTLDEVFAGEVNQITGATLYELCKIFTMSQIIERTNCGRHTDIVTESMLRKRLGDYKKKVLASGSKCAYDFEHELNQGRRDNGHKSSRMPSADLKCGKCPTCSRWRDTVEPHKVFEYWTRRHGERQTGGGDGETPAKSAVQSAFPTIKISEGPIKPAATRKRSISRLACRAKQGVYNDDRPNAIAAAKRRKHSSSDSPVTTHDASANSHSDLKARTVPLRPAQSRKALAVKSANISTKSHAASEKEGAIKFRATEGCTGPGRRVLKLMTS